MRALEVYGWQVLADRRWPGTRDANVDAIAVGPGGVVVLDVKAWAEPRLEGGHLWNGQALEDDELEQLTRVARLAEESVAGLGLVPARVHAAAVLAGRRWDAVRLDRCAVVGEHRLAGWLRRLGDRLGPSQVAQVHDVLAACFPSTAAGPRQTPTDAMCASLVPEPVMPRVAAEPAVDEAAALLDLEDLVEADLAVASEAPIEQWMTFLHPLQAREVRRNWAGPARIRGAAGTGKTVLALHRAAWLAAHGARRILFTSFVRTLPTVLGGLYQSLSPETADRVEFTAIHQWARRLLDERGVAVSVDPQGCEDAFVRAWWDVGRGSALESAVANPSYWREEIDRVIKGRGLTRFEDYASLSRVGRKTPLRAEQRAAVWDLFVAYERRLQQRGLRDWNDLLLLALAQVRLQGPEQAYDAVVVDEVQDLTRVGVQLLHALVGNRPNGLLLVGDGQQCVYPGGFTLAEAGVAVVGRSTVLDVNYRNAAGVLEVASLLVAEQDFEDLDGAAEGGRRAMQVARSGGRVVRTDAPDRSSHDAALVDMVRRAVDDHGLRLGDLAVLTASRTLSDEYRQLLQGQGLPCVDLRHYAGTAREAVKVGTFKRAKGLEFAAVFLPLLREGVPPRYDGESEAAHEERTALALRELFVGMTRARDALWLGYVAAPSLPARRHSARRGTSVLVQSAVRP